MNQDRTTQTTSQSVPTKVISIVGAHRSGSTLLDLCLDRHPSITGVSEVSELQTRNPHETRCICGSTIEECPFWSDIVSRLSRRRNLPRENFWSHFPISTIHRRTPSSKRLLPNPLEMGLILGSKRWCRVLEKLDANATEHIESLRNSWTLFETIHEKTGAPFVVDTSKSSIRMKLLHLLRPGHLRVIYLIRDVRAVAESKMRRLDWSPERAARSWWIEHRNTLLMLMTMPKNYILPIKYDEFCRHPSNTLRQICNFLGLEFQEQMLNFRSGSSHQVGGNPMRYNQNNDTIEYRDGWKERLTNRQAKKISNTALGIVGLLNRIFGYTHLE